ALQLGDDLFELGERLLEIEGGQIGTGHGRNVESCARAHNPSQSGRRNQAASANRRTAAPSVSADPTLSVNVNVEPWPKTERIVTSPPNIWAMRRAMTKPSPVPSCLRVLELSPCTKDRNNFAPSSSEMPQPVSTTSNLKSTPV